MGNIFRVINYDGDIEISIYKRANAVFKTNEYNETEDVCIHKETVNIFNLLKKNQELKDNWNKLKEYIDIKLYNVEYLQKLCGCRIDDETHIILDIIKKEMQELEGSDNNGIMDKKSR